MVWYVPAAKVRADSRSLVILNVMITGGWEGAQVKILLGGEDLKGGWRLAQGGASWQGARVELVQLRSSPSEPALCRDKTNHNLFHIIVLHMWVKYWVGSILSQEISNPIPNPLFSTTVLHRWFIPECGIRENLDIFVTS